MHGYNDNCTEELHPRYQPLSATRANAIAHAMVDTPDHGVAGWKGEASFTDISLIEIQAPHRARNLDCILENIDNRLAYCLNKENIHQ